MTNWQDCPTIVIPRARCPRCGSITPPIIFRSMSGGDDSVTRRCVCRDCSRKYVILIDPDTLPEVIPPTVGRVAGRAR
jgi:DNA-directed RNA polymerase subunit RPC12/RpoP